MSYGATVTAKLTRGDGPRCPLCCDCQAVRKSTYHQTEKEPS